METIALKGREVLNITPIGQPEKEYNSDSKLAGQKYKLFAHNGKAFAVNTNDRFIELHKTGKLYAATLAVNEEGLLSLVSCVSIEQELQMVKMETALKAYSLVEFKPTAITNPEELIAL